MAEESEAPPGPSALSRIRGSMLGLACGDSLGTAVEFCKPGSFPKIDDMVGGGAYKLEPGQWTDDTSQSLCLAESLIEKGRLDLDDNLKRYMAWYETGHMGCNGRCFDIGMTTRKALMTYTKNPSTPLVGQQSERASGNGSLMRLAPAPLAFWHQPLAAMEAAAWSSRTTHGSSQCLGSVRYFAGLLVGCMNGVSKEELLSPSYCPLGQEHWDTVSPPLHEEVKEVMDGSFKVKQPPDIVGAGYVVKTLEAVLWAFYHTDNFRDGCLMVANLGNDADTTAAIYGQLAGAYYGEDNIPQNWRDLCHSTPLIGLMADEIHLMAEYYKTQSLDHMINTGNVGGLGDSSPPTYTPSELYVNLKLGGYDPLEELELEWVRKMSPGPNAYKKPPQAEEGKVQLLEKYKEFDPKNFREDFYKAVERVMDCLIERETYRMTRGRWFGTGMDD